MAVVRRIQVAGILSLAVGLLASCSPPQDPPSAPAPDKVKVSVFPYLGYLPFFIARDEGYFRDNQLDVEFVNAPSSAGALALLAHGDIDVYAGTVTAGLLNAINRDADIRIVADKGYFGASRHAYRAFLVRPDLVESGAINDPARLKGLRVAETPAGIMQYTLDVLLASVGLALDDLRFGDVPPAALMDALANGAIDIAPVSEPWVTRLLDSGAALIWKTGPEVTANFQYAVIAFGSSLLEEKRDVGNRFMLAWLQAVRQYNQGKTDRNLEIASSQTGLDVELLRKMAWPLIRSDGHIELQSVLDFQDWCVEKGFQDRLVPDDRIYDPGFVEYANTALAEPFPPERSASD